MITDRRNVGYRLEHLHPGLDEPDCAVIGVELGTVGQHEVQRRVLARLTAVVHAEGAASVSDLVALGGQTGEFRQTELAHHLYVVLGRYAGDLCAVEIARTDGREKLLDVFGGVLRDQSDQDVAPRRRDHDAWIGFRGSVCEARRGHGERGHTGETDGEQPAYQRRPLTARSDEDSGERTAGLRRRQMTPSTKK